MSDEEADTEIDEKPRVRGFLKRGLYWGAVVGAWVAIGLAFYVTWLAQSLPDLRNLPRPGLENRIEVRAAGGQVLATYGALYGNWLAHDDIPPIMVQALVSVEDRRFYDHGAVDLRGIVRAILTKIKRGGRQQGASTITQQLAKNLFLSHERTIDRKIKELLLSLWLERTFTKDEILELYLNRVYFGGGAYGLDAATRRYFGHSGTQLTAGEAAMLAGLFKAPSSYSPTSHYDRAIKRMDRVLTVMVREEVITEGAAAHIRTNPPKTSPAIMGGNARYFTDWVMDRVGALVPLGTEPVVITTTVDAGMQHSASEAMVREVGRFDVLQGAIVAMSGDGAIKAMVGGANYAKSQFNRAVQARRQPGSSYKLFVYLEALRAGMKADDKVMDAPVEIDGWAPKNANGKYEGEMTLRRAFYRSINTVAVTLSEQIGRERVRQLAIDMGVQSPMHAHPSLALGTAEVTPMDMTRAYAVIQNGGYEVEPYGVLEVRTARGELLYRHEPKASRRIIDEDIARQMADLLKDVVRIGTGMTARIDRPAAGKTGTTQDNRDAWFLGFTSDLVAGVWVGKDGGQPMQGISGGNLPARMWADFMVDAHVGHPVQPLLYDVDAAHGIEFDDAKKDDVAPAKKKPSFLERLFGKKKKKSET